ncbi:MAG TPA: phage portal protein [Spirochaetales bacterium]|nr:phage portal protein [Spirochaetales bacterium]
MENDDLKTMFNRLKEQERRVEAYTAYYYGDHPLIYSHERLREVFNRSTVNFVQNWCAVVIDTTLDRITLHGYDNPNRSINDKLDSFWDGQNLSQLSRHVHRDSLITGNGYLMLDLIDGEKRVFYNSPSQIAIEYSDEDPNVKRLAIKVFYSAENNSTQLNLYYPDRIEKYACQGKPTYYKSFNLIDEIPEPFGSIPIIHFKAQPELTNVIPLQDAINKIFSDMMVIAEFGAFPQRWMITNADISSLTASPQSIMQIPKGTSDEEVTSVGVFQTADLAMYLDTIDKLTNTISIISRIPKHYFSNTGANVSGEALVVMETPLIKKINHIIDGLEQPWLELAKYIDESEKTVCTWERPETEQIVMQTSAMQTMVAMGIPLVTVLKRFGWGQDDINQMIADMKEDKKRNADLAEAALETAVIRLQQSNNPYLPEMNTQTQTERGEAE